MKKFPYKFKTYLLIILILAVVLSALGLGFNLYGIIAKTYDSPNALIGAILCVVISVFLLTLTVSMLCCSRYEVTKEHFILRWGVLVTKTNISTINTLVYNTTNRALAIVYDNDNVMVISTLGKEALDLVDAIRNVNKNIVFQSISDESNKKLDDKQNKK